MDAVDITPERWSHLAGPVALGRSVLIESGSPVPGPWLESPRLVLNEQSIAEPHTLEMVRRAYLTRIRYVFEVPKGFTKPDFGVNTDDLWDVQVNFDFVAEAIWRLATMNSIDARGPLEPRFPLLARAVSLGAQLSNDSTGDIILPNGSVAWCDGGPVFLWEINDQRLRGRSAISRLAIRQGVLTPICNQLVTADLAPDQLAAVADPAIRARIIAPAGSGKTRVLSERVRHLVKSGVPTRALILMAYNKKAEEEMRARTNDLVGLEIRTIDALVLAIVNGTRGFYEAKDPRQLIQEHEVRGIISQLVTFPRRANVDPVAPWISALTQARLGLESPAEVEDSYQGDVDGFAEFYPKFRAHLTEHRLADFNEFVLLAVERLLREPQARFSAERKAEVLLVDEFQDLTPAHMLLLRLLAGPTLSVFAVGDDDQTIYGFNGASPEWLVNFHEHVPHAVHHALEVNYRCPAPVVRGVSNLLSHNAFRVEKQVRHGPLNVTEPESLAVLKLENQTTAVTDRVRSLLNVGAKPGEIAILSRVNVGLLPPLLALLHAGIPVDFRNSENLLSGSGIDAVLAWLRLATKPDSFSGGDLTLAARRPGRGIHPAILKWLGQQRSLDRLHTMHAELQEPAASKVGAFIDDLERLVSEAKTGTTLSAMTLLCEQIGLNRVLASLDANRPAGVKAANSDGVRSLMALARLHADASTFEMWLREMLSSTQNGDGVVLSTVHKVKGLEWPHVVVYDASEDVFPHRLSKDLEEERRIFHVAITRCQASLLITAGPSAPSVFLSELNSPASALAKPTPLPVPSRPEPSTRVTRSSLRSSSAPRRPPRLPESVEAKVGLAFRWGGYDCVVDEVNDAGVVVLIGANRLTVEFGERIIIRGSYRTLVSLGSAVVPGPSKTTSTASHSVNASLREALRTWRLEQASTERVPAFIIFYDTALDELCEKLPRTLPELRQVKGFGPVKVDKYGDYVLAIISEYLD
jgi:DNA helicase-2/ATP-dependent DNA helicase PcrA